MPHTDEKWEWLVQYLFEMLEIYLSPNKINPEIILLKHQEYPFTNWLVLLFGMYKVDMMGINRRVLRFVSTVC